MGLNIVAVGQPPKHLVRLNSDGTLDSSFNYSISGSIRDIALDSPGGSGLTEFFKLRQAAATSFALTMTARSTLPFYSRMPAIYLKSELRRRAVV